MKIYCVECRTKFWVLNERIDIKCLSEYRFIFRVGAIAFKSCNQVGPATGLYTQEIETFELVCENCFDSRRKIEAVRTAEINSKINEQLEAALNSQKQRTQQLQEEIERLRELVKQIDMEDLRTCKEILNYKTVDKLVKSILIHNSVIDIMCDFREQRDKELFNFVNRPSLHLVNQINKQTDVFLEEMMSGVSFLLDKQKAKLDRTFSIQNATKLRMEQKCYVKEYKINLFSKNQQEQSASVYTEQIRKIKSHIELFSKFKQDITFLISGSHEF